MGARRRRRLPQLQLPDVKLPNLPMPTFGGFQFWGDLHWREGWRIQQHCETGHFRLLDRKGLRRAWGSYAACLMELRAKAPAPPTEARPMVVLLHGMGRSPHSFAGMRKGLAERGWEVATLNYPSLRRSLHELARQVQTWLSRLEGVNEVHFATHSLGGVVLRAAMEGLPAGKHDDDAVPPWSATPQIGSAVMIAPPSHGSALADRLNHHRAYRWLYGDVGQVLLTGELADLPLPTFRFAVVAGARGEKDGWNPLIPGDDDGVVGVAETLLEGAEEHVVLSGPKAVHAFVMNHPEAIAGADRFFRGGHFREVR